MRRRLATIRVPYICCLHLSAVNLFPSGPSKPGHSNEDALGAEDPIAAVSGSLRENEKKDVLPEDIDPVASSVNRRRNRRKRSVDTIFGDVLHDALRLRDMGHKPDADFVYKRTQERMYEEEYGRKPPSAKEHAAKFTPFPPDFCLNRLIPFEEIAETSEDPWPERSVTPLNPVWTRHQVQEDQLRTGGAKLREMERKMYAPREGFDPIAEFTDSLEELGHWEVKFIRFIRDVPISQRRTLPFLHEHYRFLTHRLIRAERRFMSTRDAALAKAHASTSVYKMTEEKIDRTRALYAETHRSLSSPNYDPARMKKSIIGPLIAMSEAEFDEWQNVEKHRRNRLASELL